MRSGHGSEGCRRQGEPRSTKIRLLSVSPRLPLLVGAEGVGQHGARGAEGGQLPRPLHPWCATAVGHRAPLCPFLPASPHPRRWFSGPPRRAPLRAAPSPAAPTRVVMPAPAPVRLSAACSAIASTYSYGWVDLRARGPPSWPLKASPVPHSFCLPHPIKFSAVPQLAENCWRNRPTWNLCDSPSQSAASLCFCTAVHWLISQSLSCCPYWLLLLSIRFSSEPSPRLCLCEFLLSGRAAEAPLRIGQREKPVILSYWSMCRWTILIGWTEQSLSSGRALPGWELRAE